MRITKQRLKEIIKEESGILLEQVEPYDIEREEAGDEGKADGEAGERRGGPGGFFQKFYDRAYDRAAKDGSPQTAGDELRARYLELNKKAQEGRLTPKENKEFLMIAATLDPMRENKMKLTKQRLQEIIKEETLLLFNEMMGQRAAIELMRSAGFSEPAINNLGYLIKALGQADNISPELLRAAALKVPATHHSPGQAVAKLLGITIEHQGPSRPGRRLFKSTEEEISQGRLK